MGWVGKGKRTCDVGICGCFERAQSVADDKDGCAETAKRSVEDAWPG